MTAHLVSNKWRLKLLRRILMAEIHLFRDTNFRGGSIIKTGDDRNLHTPERFGDVISSVRVISGTFTLFQDSGFSGYSFTVCKTGGPNSDGEYPSARYLADRGDRISSLKVNSDQPA
jgi:hypothetical protein